MKSENIFLIVMTLFMAALLIGLLWFLVVADKRSDKNRYKDGNAVLITTNSIGCAKYRYKNDEFWKCPKTLNIQQIEERTRVSRRHITIKQAPVVSE